jgi:hypothetical protein
MRIFGVAYPEYLYAINSKLYKQLKFLISVSALAFMASGAPLWGMDDGSELDPDEELLDVGSSSSEDDPDPDGGRVQAIGENFIELYSNNETAA